jgi:hypothetical protein
MRAKGITYDTGFVRDGAISREHLDPEEVGRELRIIRDDLHCNALRVTGGDAERLEVVATLAVDLGLEVWFSPYPLECTTDEMLSLFADCAERAERLRRRGGDIVFVTGAELSLMNKGFLPADDLEARVELLTRPDRLREQIGEISTRVNDFLGRAVALVRERFGGRVTYAAVPLERVDWAPFDIVSMDLYRSAEIADQFTEGVRNLVQAGKPVAITEFGAATYRGAGDAGARGLEIVEYDKTRRSRSGRLPTRTAGCLRRRGHRQHLCVHLRASRPPAPARRRPARRSRSGQLRHRQGLRGPSRGQLSRPALGAQSRVRRSGGPLPRTLRTITGRASCLPHV